MLKWVKSSFISAPGLQDMPGIWGFVKGFIALSFPECIQRANYHEEELWSHPGSDSALGSPWASCCCLSILLYIPTTQDSGNSLTNCGARGRNNACSFYHSFGLISSGFRLKFQTLSTSKYLVLSSTAVVLPSASELPFPACPRNWQGLEKRPGGSIKQHFTFLAVLFILYIHIGYSEYNILYFEKRQARLG